jgi:fructose-1-phosphate kinase PfkB-like protein
VISGSLPPGISVDNLTQLVKNAQQHGLRCIVDSSGDALAAALMSAISSWLSRTRKSLARWYSAI